MGCVLRGEIILKVNYVKPGAKQLPKIYTLERATNHRAEINHSVKNIGTGQEF